MALFKRPNADYQPDKNLPNYDAFQRLAGEKKPLPSRLLDALANYVIDGLNALSDALDKAKAGVFPGSDDPANKDKIIYSDGTTGKWGKIVGALMDMQTVTSREIKDREVKKGKIDVGAVGTEELADNSIPDKKIQSVSLPKIRSSGNASLVVGQKGGSHYGELSYLGVPKLALPAVGDDGILKLYNLTSIWYYADGQYEGSKLRDQTTPLSKLDVGANNSGVVGSGNGTRSASFINADNTFLGILSGGGSNEVSFRKIAQVLNNDNGNVGEIDGKILKSASVDYGVLDPVTNPLSNIKFFDMGKIINGVPSDFAHFTVTKTGGTLGMYDFTVKGAYRTGNWAPNLTFYNALGTSYVMSQTPYSFRLFIVNKNGAQADIDCTVQVIGT